MSKLPNFYTKFSFSIVPELTSFSWFFISYHPCDSVNDLIISTSLTKRSKNIDISSYCYYFLCSFLSFKRAFFMTNFPKLTNELATNQ